MSLKDLVSKYIGSAEHVFETMKATKTPPVLEAEGVGKIVDFAKAYLEDAKYYREKQKLEVSLTSIAYCEGLLDALRMLGAVKFDWPTKAKRKRSVE
jgi:FAD synthetase